MPATRERRLPRRTSRRSAPQRRAAVAADRRLRVRRRPRRHVRRRLRLRERQPRRHLRPDRPRQLRVAASPSTAASRRCSARAGTRTRSRVRGVPNDRIVACIAATEASHRDRLVDVPDRCTGARADGPSSRSSSASGATAATYMAVFSYVEPEPEDVIVPVGAIEPRRPGARSTGAPSMLPRRIVPFAFPCADVPVAGRHLDGRQCAAKSTRRGPRRTSDATAVSCRSRARTPTSRSTSRPARARSTSASGSSSRSSSGTWAQLQRTAPIVLDRPLDDGVAAPVRHGLRSGRCRIRGSRHAGHRVALRARATSPRRFGHHRHPGTGARAGDGP